MKKVYIFNGPPGSGKDTLGALLTGAITEAQGLKAKTFAFKNSLYKMTFDWLTGDTHFTPSSNVEKLMQATGNTLERFIEVCEDRKLKEAKMLPIGLTFNVEGNKADFGHKIWSPRMCLQFVSEKLAKPGFGPNVFGIEAFSEVKSSAANEGTEVAVFTDGGFIDEIECGATMTDAEVVVINLYREGCNFDGDSRDYVTSSEKDIKFVRFDNDQGIPESLASLCELLNIVETQ